MQNKSAYSTFIYAVLLTCDSIPNPKIKTSGWALTAYTGHMSQILYNYYEA